ncbi:MAG: sulfite exporter TauE/SafE family protein [Chamaesiphon sp.]|nr:sulfite exporter TauE/SafE family protein [Chamaesiphon sp.]
MPDALIVENCKSIGGYLASVCEENTVDTIGTLLGTYLARFVSAQQLQTGFGYFLLVVAGFILFQNRHSFDRSLPDRSNLPINTNTPHDKVAYLDRSKVLDN